MLYPSRRQKRIWRSLLIVCTIALSLIFIHTARAGSAMDFSYLQKAIPNNPLTPVPAPTGLNLPNDRSGNIPPNLSRSVRPDEGSRAVIGVDDRVPVTSRKYPWSAIGRVVGISDKGEGYQCTGTLIGDNIVLTNSHCVINPKTHLLSKVIAFEPNLIDDRLVNDNDRAFAKKVYYGTDFKNDRFPEQDDWALIELDRPLAKKYGSLDWQPLPTSTLVGNPGDFILVGYSGDFPKNNPGSTAGADPRCSIVGEVSGVFTHTCDSMPGSSGGPILINIKNDFKIVGLNSAYIQNTQNKAAVNFAVKISRVVEQIK